MRLLAPWRRPSTMWGGMDQFRTGMDHVFDQFLGGANETGFLPGTSAPFMNVWEDQDSVFVETELPGIKLDDLDISIMNQDELTVRGTRTREETQSAEWFRRECQCGAFERTITLPSPVDPKQVDAHLDNGVLTIQMAKSPDAKPTKITVHGN